MAGGFDEKAGGAQMGVMQGPMVSEWWWDLLPLVVFNSQMVMNLLRRYALRGIESKEKWLDRPSEEGGLFEIVFEQNSEPLAVPMLFFCCLILHFLPHWRGTNNQRSFTWLSIWKLQDGHISNRHRSSPGEEIPMQDLNSSRGGRKQGRWPTQDLWLFSISYVFFHFFYIPIQFQYRIWISADTFETKITPN